MENTQQPDAAFRELAVERLVLREPGQGRVRAILEAVPPGEGEPRAHGVRLVLLDALGAPVVTAEVSPEGEPMVTVGGRDGGKAAVVRREVVELWRGGNAVVTLAADEMGGLVEVLDEEGEVAGILPAPTERP
jgi:hypothetical protein